MTPGKPLVGWMIIEDYVEDYSEWDGAIACPDPTGANLAWESPIKMIEHAAYTELMQEAEALREALRLHCYEGAPCIDETEFALKRFEKFKEGLK